jgi:hypothetical protein
MSAYDIIAKQQAEVKTAKNNNRRLSKEKYAAQKQEQRDELYERLDETAMRVVGSADVLKDFLDTAAHFPRHSVNKQLLIFATMPKATRVADFDTWKAQGVAVHKHEKSVISVLEAAGEYQRADGKMGVNYEVQKVFDISQTNAKQTPAPSYSPESLLEAVLSDRDVKINVAGELADNRVALYSKPDNSIAILSGLETEPLFRALTIELAQASFAKGNPAYDRGSCQVQSILASYTLCKRYGLDGSGLDFSRLVSELPHFETPKDARAFLNEVRGATNELSSHMAKMLEKAGTEKTLLAAVPASPAQSRSDRDER